MLFDLLLIGVWVLLFCFWHVYKGENLQFITLRKQFFFNQRNISLIYGQRKNFFESKEVLLIQKNFLWSKEIDLFTLKTIFLNQQNFL